MKKMEQSETNTMSKSSVYNSFNNPVFIALFIIVFGAIILAYSNHFSNALAFDDMHTIANNIAIREINITKIFTDASTFSTLPGNQSYRPYLTLENAIDYKLAGGLNTKVFHIHIFITFLLVCFLLWLFVKKVLDKIKFSNYNPFWGLLIAAIFGLLCANTQAVNYIIQRAEIDAALFILAGFVAFLQGGIWRSKYLYLLFPFIGFFAKEMTFTFAPLLFLYILLFEENTDLLHFYKTEEFKKCTNAFRKTLPAFVLTLIMFAFYHKMQKLSPGGTDRFLYLITQPAVMCHYIITYFIPYNLSADSDWTVFPSLLNFRAILGIVLILGLIYVALKASKNKETRLFSFGILWFFIALLPTSSVVAFAEVLNDHRCFTPYIGLTIAFVFGLKHLLEKYFADDLKQKSTQIALMILTILFLATNAYGVHQRNKVWKDGLTLWADVAQKSPKNGRGLMNYGLELMQKGDFVNAEIYYNKAILANPSYAVIYINLGILKKTTGDKVSAENNFKKAISCPGYKDLSLYYYGRFLTELGRDEEAEQNLTKAININPNFYDAQSLLLSVYHNKNEWEKMKILAQNILQYIPNDENAKKYLDIAIHKKTIVASMEEEASKAPTPDKYLNLSLKYCKIGENEKSIVAAYQAIKLKSDFPAAYNNIGIAYVNLKDYDKAIEAYTKALSIYPDYQLAKNNLFYALSLKNGTNTEIVSQKQ